MAWFSLPPHVFAPIGDGPPTGPTIALFEAIASRMGKRVEWIGPIPLNRLGQEQQTGELGIDGTILHMRTPVTAKLLLFPSRPYFVAAPSLGLRADNPLSKIEGIKDIAGYRIGFVKTLSSNYPPFLAENRDLIVIDELSGEDWTARNLRKLLEGRLDAVYERNQYNLPYAATIAGIGDRIKVVPLPMEPIGHYFVFHKTSPRAQALLEAYERAVRGFAFDYDEMVKAEMRIPVK